MEEVLLSPYPNLPESSLPSLPSLRQVDEVLMTWPCKVEGGSATESYESRGYCMSLLLECSCLSVDLRVCIITNPATRINYSRQLSFLSPVCAIISFKTLPWLWFPLSLSSSFMSYSSGQTPLFASRNLGNIYFFFFFPNFVSEVHVSLFLSKERWL